MLDNYRGLFVTTLEGIKDMEPNKKIFVETTQEKYDELYKEEKKELGLDDLSKIACTGMVLPNKDELLKKNKDINV